MKEPFSPRCDQLFEKECSDGSRRRNASASQKAPGFSAAIVVMILQFPSKAVQFKRIGPEKGDSGSVGQW
jgi:hypothetical protein